MAKKSKREHTCNVCQSSGPWGKGWQYYSSFRAEDDGLPVLKTCSDKCRAKIDDPDIWLLRLWLKAGARPSKKVLKTFRRFPDEVAQFK